MDRRSSPTRFLTLILFVITAMSVWGADSPKDRRETDPRSITSVANRAAKPVPVDDLLFSRRVSGPAWSPDGKQIVFTTNLTGRLNLWKVSADGGWPIQLLQSDDRQNGAMWTPDGKWIIYEQDKGGNEQWQLYMVASDGGEPIALTNQPENRYSGSLLSPDGKLIAVGVKAKTSPSTNIAILDLATRQVRNLTNEKAPDHYWGVTAWSPDGKWLYAHRNNASFTDASVYRIDVQSGASEELTPHSGQIVYGASHVSPDGRTLLVTSNEKGGYNNVALLDVATKSLHWVTNTEWEAAGGDFSPDGQHFTYVINEDGRSHVYIADRSGKAEELNFPDGITSPTGHPREYSPKGDYLLISHQDARRPSDLWVYNIATGKARQLTFSTIASLNPDLLPSSQIVHYKSFDGQMISALLWMPFNLQRDGSNPAIVLPHGGPTGQTVDSFNTVAASLSSRGYICIAPNVRGSTGYGIAFQKANYQDLGGGDLQDEVYATKFLTATGYVDANRIGITGGSYGGYMTLIALGRTPNIWAAGVEQYGIMDWLTMLQHADPFLQTYIKALLGDPDRDRGAYAAASPIKYLRNATAPLLVLQGENDIRVPKEEAEQVVRLYQEMGRPVDAKFYPQEGHGFARRENQVDALRRMIDWFDRYLKPPRKSAMTGQ